MTNSTVPIRYRVEVLNPHAHLLGITLEIDQPTRQQRFSLPVWIPGSYLVREFAQHLQHLRAECGGQPLALQQLNKTTWEARPRVPQPHASDDGTDTTPPITTLTLRYEVYAFDASVRTAYLDQQRGFFNPTSLCLRVHGHDHLPHQLTVAHNAHTHGWQVATGLSALDTQTDGFGSYNAANYNELADSPFELGTFWNGQFEVRGVPHRFVVSGAPPGFDSQRLLADTQKICAAQIDFWHGPDATPPFAHYVFMLHATQDGYGGLEHRNSTALICQRSDLPCTVAATDSTTPPKPSDGYTTLLGLISHEYFHTWNVKRLRPAELAQYDYDRENHTPLLWFFEGFTSYYDDLFLLRTGLIDTATYLQLLAKTINQVLQTPGRHVQSVAQASFDAWTKYYRVQENTPNATVSYYTKGALVALCLDLTLRSEGHTTLDAVMRQLYQRCNGGPMTEANLLTTLKDLGQRSFALEVADWVHGTADLPLPQLLPAHGIRWTEEPAPTAQRLGLRVTEGNGLLVKNVLRGSAAETAGLAAGDEWLAVELPVPTDSTTPPSAWRVKKLDDVAFYTQGHPVCTAIVARDGRLLRCPLNWPAPALQIKLERDTSAPATTGWLPAP